MRGRLQKYHSNYYYVDVHGVLYECFLKGLLKKALKGNKQTGNEEIGDLLVGDWVTLDSVDASNQTARIADIESRQNALTRPKIANVDQAFVVYPLKQPEFDSNALDRYLTHVALAGIPACICISKADLAESPDTLDRIRELYGKRLGYALAFVSVYQADTIGQVQALLTGKTSVLAGPSGAGKSSLINAIQPNLQLRVGEVSEKIERGQHTTRHTELLSLGTDTFVADTPGFSYLRFDTTLPQTLAGIYPEFQNTNVHCEFSDCLHLAPEAVSDGEGAEIAIRHGCAFLDENTHLPKTDLIAESRYASYCVMMKEALTFKQAVQQSSQKQEYGFKQVSNKGSKNRTILKLQEKNREASRRTQRQKIEIPDADLDSEDE